jgi:hypothetical protein
MINGVLKWCACFITLAGALLTANEIHTINRELFVVGGLLYLIWSIRIREWNLIVINTALITIYAVGLLRG